jgi:hypothetical protein
MNNIFTVIIQRVLVFVIMVVAISLAINNSKANAIQNPAIVEIAEQNAIDIAVINLILGPQGSLISPNSSAKYLMKNVRAMLNEPVDPIATAGRSGIPGDIGPQGERGLTGATGPQGVQGEKGDKGDTGEKGEKGDKGEPGEKGEPGAQGPSGYSGPQGPQGTPGIVGLMSMYREQVICDKNGSLSMGPCDKNGVELIILVKN